MACLLVKGNASSKSKCFFDKLHGIGARRSFCRLEGSKCDPKRRQKGEKKQAQKQEGFGVDFGGPDVIQK